MTPTREQLDALIAQWRRDADGYPVDQPGALHAATAVRLCADELAACLAAPSMDDFAALLLVIAAVAVILEAPLLKPWSGFRKPKGHPGRWFR